MSELRFHTFNPSTIDALMTDNYPNTQELEARIETLGIAFRALTSTLTHEQDRKLKSKIAERVEEHLLRPNPINEADPYALEMRKFSTTLLESGPELPYFVD